MLCWAEARFSTFFITALKHGAIEFLLHEKLLANDISCDKKIKAEMKQYYSLLGYTEKWMNYGLLDEATLARQLKEFEKGENTGTEHYRYAKFLNWLRRKQHLTNEEIRNYIELALTDEEETMGGSAVKVLFEQANLTDEQYEYVKHRLPEFGVWTQKVISRDALKREIEKTEITAELIIRCWEHKIKYKENRVIERLLPKIHNPQLLKVFEQFELSKNIRRMIDDRFIQIE